MTLSEEFLKNKKKKKKLSEDFLEKNNKVDPFLGDTKESILNKADTAKWFKKGAFDDGYQFGDITKTTLSSAGDAGVGIVRGIMNIGENVGDLISYGRAGIADWIGNDEKAEKLRKKAQYNGVENLLEPVSENLDKKSIFGDKSDSIAEGIGYVAGLTAVSIASAGVGSTLGVSSTAAATVGSTATTFSSAMGSGITEAYKDGANDEEATWYGVISGAGEAVSELMFGGLGKFTNAVGLSKGIGELDDIIANNLTKKVKNKMVKTLMKSGIKATGEGLEEVASGLISALGKKLTYMDEKKYSEIVKDENLAEQFFMGALTSAIVQGPSTLRSIRNSTDYITGRTENEQRVYDDEFNARKNERIRQSTIDKVYREQIKTQENLGNNMTEEQKAKLKRKVEKAYDNGKLTQTNLNNKELLELEKQVDNDMNEGNISWDRIVNTLGENQDISKDNLLRRSKYENEQRYNSYQVEKTDNEKVNILMQSAADAGMNNTSKTRKKIELISKLVEDTDRQYKFVSPEQLTQMGYNEKANGLIDKSTGEILINTHTDKGIQAIVGHETTHIFDGKNEKGEYSKEYQVLQDMAIEYAKSKGIYDSKVQSITETYGDLLVEESQFKEELTADLIGDFLFNDEKFIENLAIKDKNVFQKIYDYIKHTYKMITAKTEDAKALENLKYQFDKVYKTISENNNADVKYSIAGKEGMNNAIKKDTDYLKLERAYNKAQQMQKNGMDNEDIRKNTGWFQDKNGDWKFEFSDKDMSIKENIKLEKNKTYKLGDILKHDTLFTAYPELANYNVSFIEMKQGGSYNRENNNIKINSDKINSNFAVESTLIHEIQHAIQSIEGFEGGKGSNFKLAYYKSLGEIEASDTKKRFVLEKQKRLDRSLVKPESSKSNPKHSNLNNYLKNRKFIDKIKDSVYNYLNSKSKEGGDSYESYQENMERNNQKDSGLVSERTDRDSGSDGTLGNRRNKNRENRKKDGEKISEINSKLQERSRKNAKAIYKNEEKDSSKVWNNGIDNNIEESGNNSGSFSLTNDTSIIGDDIAVKDMLVQKRSTIESEVGNISKQEKKTNALTVEDALNQTPEQKQQGMKEKARKYLSRSKTNFINKIVNDFGTSKIANTKTLNSVVDKIREDIQNSGTLTKEKTDAYFDELYDNMITIDTMYYDTYKEVKNEIRSTKLYASDAIRSDMSDYDGFRKNNMGTLILTNDSNNLPVDTYYQKLNEIYPELFPEDITNPTEQLERISEVTKDISKVEMNVSAYNDKYMGKEYRAWARAEFDKDINNFMQDIKLADRYNTDSNERIKYEVNKEHIKSVYQKIPNARRKYEKIMARELLTKKDKVQVERLLNNEITPQEIPNGLNKKGIINVANAKLEYDTLQKEIKAYQDEIKRDRIEQAEKDVGNLNLWKDKKIGFGYSRETPIRNIYDIAPKEVADNVVNKYFRSYIEVNEKKVVDDINGYNDRIRNLDIGTNNKYEITYNNKTKKVSESALIQLLGEKKITTEDIKESGANVTKIENAVKEFRDIYNELITQINESMLNNGYAPIEYRKDYFPHFTEETTDTLLGKIAKLAGIDITNREELPTDIAGQSYQFKPGRTWFSSMLQRTTDITDYDVLKGFDKYVRGATDLIYHTGDIQNLRALSTVIRGAYNDTEIQNRIEEIKESSTMSDLDKAIAIQGIFDKAKDKSHLSKFVEWLDNYTNLLAGKKAINDRGAEKELNRQVYKTMQDIESRIAANAIGGNVGVSLTNFGVISQAWGEIKTTNLINGIWQTIKSSLKGDNSFVSESQFITRRRGTDTLVESTLDKITKPLNTVLEFADNFSSEVIVRSRYNQNLQEGMSSDLALQEADRYAAGLMADRGRGALPTQFSNKNPISKMINMFQVEVNNQWSYYLKDLPKNMESEANNNRTKIVKDLAVAYTKIIVGSYLTNELLGAIRGKSTRVLPDPIYIVKELIKGLTDDDDENDDDSIISMVTEIAGNVPFISLPATLFADSLGLDVGDIGRISVSGAIPNVVDITKDLLDKDMTGKEKAKNIIGELADTLGASLLLPYGGSQIKKTVKGLSMYKNNIPGSYTNKGDLRYTVEDNVGSKIQSAIFGAYANPYAQDYIDSGYKSINKNNIEEMVGLGMNSTEYRKYKKDLSKFKKNEEKLKYINSLDLTDEKKTIAANNLNKNSKKKIDMSEYNDYSSYDEYEYARDYPDKYNVVMQITDYDSFIESKKEISNIKEKYSTEQGYGSEERKEAVRNYIDSLDLDKYQKIMLEKMAGGYSIKDYKNSIYAYLENTKLSQNDKYKIWKELFE